MPEPRRLIAPPRRAPLSLTSLIDVIFLLLLFFMLTSTFTRLGELELTAAPQGGAEAPQQPPVFVQLGADTLRLNADPLAPEALRARLIDLAGAGGLVLIALAEDVTAQRLVDILALLRGAPFAVRVLT
jgi:biopolymer transport protein ExbD